ncbi:hypothetical protein ABBQ32_011960 [Trebouxia sp. C0010 RCD-2024]
MLNVKPLHRHRLEVNQAALHCSRKSRGQFSTLIGMSIHQHYLRNLPHCVHPSAAFSAQATHPYAHRQSWQHVRPRALSQKGRDNVGIIEEEDDVNLVEETFRQAYRNSQAAAIYASVSCACFRAQALVEHCRSGRDGGTAVQARTHLTTYSPNLIRMETGI